MLVFIEDPEQEDNPRGIYVSGQVINVRHIESGMRLLKFFGHLIEKLRFHYREGYLIGIDPQELTKYINLYCSDTLKEFSLWNMDAKYEYLLSGMTKPFTAVENLRVDGAYKTMASPSLSFAELFPATRQLFFAPNTLFDKESFVQTFPQLEHLILITSQSNLLESDLEKMLMRNPHIQSLTLYYSTPEFLCVVNELLPNITELNLFAYNTKYLPNNRDIFFKHVTSFELEMSGLPPTNIHFEHLIEFKVDLYKLRDDFVKLIEQNPHLEIFHMRGGFIDDIQLRQITALDLKLREVVLHLENTNNDTIFTFARKMRTNVNKMEFVSNKHTDSQQLRGLDHLMQKEFGDEFNVSQLANGVSLKRRNLIF